MLEASSPRTVYASMRLLSCGRTRGPASCCCENPSCELDGRYPATPPGLPPTRADAATRLRSPRAQGERAGAMTMRRSPPDHLESSWVPHALGESTKPSNETWKFLSTESSIFSNIITGHAKSSVCGKCRTIMCPGLRTVYPTHHLNTVECPFFS